MVSYYYNFLCLNRQLQWFVQIALDLFAIAYGFDFCDGCKFIVGIVAGAVIDRGGTL